MKMLSLQIKFVTDGWTYPTDGQQQNNTPLIFPGGNIKKLAFKLEENIVGKKNLG